MDFAGVLERIARRFEDEGEPFALVGGLGLSALGITRATVDIDLLAPARIQGAVVEMMEQLGYETLHRSTGYSNHLHSDEQLGRVDFVYVRGRTEETIFANARRTEGPQGVTVLVPKPEHLAAMKVLAMKNDPRRRLQDLADIARILELEGVDEGEIRDAFERHGMLRSWNELRSDDRAD